MPQEPFDLVVTGGIATGKSSWLTALLALAPDIGHFDCDKAVHELLTERQILESLRQLFGDGVFDPDDQSLNRSALRQLVFDDEACRRDLEGVLHPAVRARFEQARAGFLAQAPHGVFIADVPLFYETAASYPHDLVVVVATTPETQRQRLRQRQPGLGHETAQSIIHAQKPITEKVRHADLVVWNEGPPARLHEQAADFVKALPALRSLI